MIFVCSVPSLCRQFRFYCVYFSADISNPRILQSGFFYPDDFLYLSVGCFLCVSNSSIPGCFLTRKHEALLANTH